jgi:Ca-activated chloride channel family protein
MLAVHHLHPVFLVLLSAVLFDITSPSDVRASEPSPDQTLSPYFFVEGGDPAIDAFPLEGTHVEVEVSGMIAAVRVTQIYTNEGRRPIHARYVFPASTRAAVNGLRMAIDGQVIEAEIQEKKRAQATFEAAQQAGQSASLLEQQRPNVFSMRVANVMPGDRIEVTLRYTELLVPTDGRYELVYPTVVGPRYASAARVADGERDDGWIATPYVEGDRPGGAPAPARFSLSGTIAAGLPIRDPASPSHAIEVDYESPDLVRFALSPDEEGGANRDFLLGWRLSGDSVQAGLSLYDAGDEKFFLVSVEPPGRVPQRAIPPRELVFIVDVSGSMQGFPLDTAKQLLRGLTSELRSSDKFNVLLFSGGSRLLAPVSLPATTANVDAALAVIDGEQGGGGTELLAALARSLELSPEPGLARSFLVITDGYVQADHDAVELVARSLGEANVFAFGIGQSVNRFLIEGLALAGQGEPFVVPGPAGAESVARAFAAYVNAPVLTDVQVRFDGFEAYDVQPRAIPDVFAARPVVVYGKWRGEATGTIEVAGVGGDGPFSQKLDVGLEAPLAANEPLAQLWARRRIAALSDYGLATPGESVRREILALGLRYHLLTDYTSFVAVSRVVRNPAADATDVKQPLPLPSGVSASAIGVTTGVGSEPELWVLVCVLAGIAVTHARWRVREQRRRAYA